MVKTGIARAACSLVIPLVFSGCDVGGLGDGVVVGDEAAVREALDGYFAALKAKDLRQLEQYTTRDFVLYENGYPIDRDRLVEIWDSLEAVSTAHRFRHMQITLYGNVAHLSYELEWLEEGTVSGRGRETGLAQRTEDHQWRFSYFHSSWFPPIRPLHANALRDYLGVYSSDRGDVRYDLRIRESGGRLYLERDDGRDVAMGLTRLALFPEGEDRFYLEGTTDRLVMARGADGHVVSMVVHPLLSWNTTYRWVRIPSG